MRARLLWSLLVSAVLNAIAWTAVSDHAAVFSVTQAQAPRESVIVMRWPKVAARRAQSLLSQELAMARPPASLSVPHGWDRADAGIGTTDVAMWLNWRDQRSKWIPRVTIWGMKLEPLYMRRPSLQTVIHEIVGALHEDALLLVSKAQRVCDGKRDGWFLSYVKGGDDPPLHFDETLFLAGNEVYRAMYIRDAAQPEDPRMRDALRSLCPSAH